MFAQKVLIHYNKDMDDSNGGFYRGKGSTGVVDDASEGGNPYSAHDPYQNAQAENKAAAAGKADAGAHSDAVSALSAAENSATNSSPSTGGGLYKRETSLGDNLHKTGGLASNGDGSKSGSGFKNSVQGTAKDLSKAATGGAAAKLTAAKNLLKNKGPFGFILAIVAVIGVGILASQSLMPFSVVARFIEEYNGLSFVNENRYDMVLTRALRKSGTKSYNTAVEALKKQGIEVKTEGGNTTMTWLDSDGNSKSISGSGLDLLNKIKGALDTDANFSNKYIPAVSSWRGKGSSWFDNITVKVLNRLELSRNRWQWWDSSDDTDAETKAKQFTDTARNPKNTETEVQADSNDEPEDEDGDTDPDTDPDADPDTDSDTTVRPETIVDGTDMTDIDAVKAKIRSIASRIDIGAGLLDAAVNITCGAVTLYTAVSLIIFAHQVAEVLNAFSGLVEAIDKAKAGDGTNSPINEYMTTLTKTDENGKTAMSSSGMAVLYTKATGGDYTYNEAVQIVNNESAFSNVFGFDALAGMSAVSAFAICAYARATSATIQTVLGILTFGAFSFISSLLGFITSLLQAAGINAAIEALAGFVQKVFTTDVIGKNMFGELFGNYIASGGNIYLSKNSQTSGSSPGGATAINAYNAYKQESIAKEAARDRATLSPFDTSSKYTFMGSIMESLISLSTTSMGNALTSTVTAIGSTLTSSLTSLLPSASALATTRMNQTNGNCQYLESVGAVGDMYCNPYYVDDFSTIDTDINTVIRNVANLGSFEGYSTLTDDQIQQYIDGELELEIKESSNLYKYIVYCGGRESIYGVADGNIASELNSASTGNSALDTIIGAIPVVGDVQGALEAAQDIKNVGWVGGGYCINTEQNTAKDGWGGWEGEGKWYQRFTEDSRLMENMGFFDDSDTTAIEVDQERAESGIIAYDANETYDENGDIIAYDVDGDPVDANSTAGMSAVSKAMLAYYEENPVDTSELGWLSRYSGLTKDEVIAVLDEVDTVLARLEYDPTGRGPATTSEPQTLAADTLIASLTSDAPTSSLPKLLATTPKYVAYQQLEYTTSA